jgi:hypothetical protein
MQQNTSSKLAFAGALLAAFVVVMPGRASAQPAAGFSTLDRSGPYSRGGVDFGLSFGKRRDVIPNVSVTSLRIDAHLQLMSPSGFGGYLLLPMSAVWFDNNIPGQSDSTFAIADIDLGGQFAVRRLPIDLVFRLGVAFPTAGSSPIDQASNLRAAFVRIGDFPLSIQKSTWLRMAASMMSKARRGLFWRVDGGLDVPINQPSGLNLDPALRLNLGGGYRFQSVALMAELVNEFLFRSFSQSRNDSVHTISITARYVHGFIEPSFGFVIPINDTLRDQGFNFGLVFGIQGTSRW